MATFNILEMDRSYGVIDPETGHWLTQGIQGSDALRAEWPEGAEAWDPNEQEFHGTPYDIAA